MSAFTETIAGDPQEPINLVITARNEAGWLAQGRQPNDKAFQKPTADQTLRQRHHVRFWQSGMVTPDGDAIFVGAASGSVSV